MTIIEVEHASFTPIVLSTSSGWGPSTTVVFRRLAGILSVKLADHSSQPCLQYIGGHNQPLDLFASVVQLCD